MPRIDYMEDESGDLLFDNGDLVRGVSDGKHIKDILSSKPGDFPQHPLVGVSPTKYQKGDPVQNAIRFKRDVKVALRADGYTNVSIDIDDFGNIKIRNNG